MNPFNLFQAPARPDDWFSVGLSSSFPDLGWDDGDLAQTRACGEDFLPGCKAFRVPATEVSKREEVSVEDGGAGASEIQDLSNQVLVFQYKKKFVAIDNRCPHSSFPLSKGTPFDIEDFGVVLSAGIQCPKHSWSFDLFTGISDRAMYRLTVWEVRLQDIGAKPPARKDTVIMNSDGTEKEVWVRRKPRMG